MPLCRAAVLGLFSAGLVNLSGRPWSTGYVAWLALLPLLWCLLRTDRWWTALLAGTLTGLGMSLLAFEGVLPSQPWVFAAVLIPQAAWFGLAATLTVLTARALGARAALALFPLFWVCAELLPAQAWLWGDFANPLMRWGYSQVDTVLLGLAPWSGVTGLTVAVLYINVALAKATFDAGPSRSFFPLAATGTLVGLGLWLSPTAQPESTRAPLRVAAVQAAHASLDTIQARFDDAAAARLLDPYENLSHRASERDVDLVVWGETVVPQPLTRPALTPPPRLRSALEGVDRALIGAITETATTRHNSVVAWQDGELSEVYRKRRLIPVVETTMYDPGARVPPVSIDDVPIGLSICLDVAFPHVVRESVRAGARLLVSVTNDAFARQTVTSDLHANVAAMRAAEVRRPLLFLNQAGPSAFLDAYGRRTNSSARGEVVALMNTMQPHVGATPYVRFGDWVGALATIVTAAWLVTGVVHRFTPTERTPGERPR